MMQDIGTPDTTPDVTPTPEATPSVAPTPAIAPTTPVVSATPVAATTGPTIAVASAKAAIEEKKTKKKSGASVLIVEDDTFLVRAYEVMLSSQGFNVTVVTDGEAAMEHLKKGDLPEVMLLDLMLPKLSGFEVLQQIQADTKLKDVPVIVLSNLGQPDDITRAKELGAKDYFVKADTPLEKVVAVIGKFTTDPKASSNLSESATPIAQPVDSVPQAPVTPTPATPVAPKAPVASVTPAQAVVPEAVAPDVSATQPATVEPLEEEPPAVAPPANPTV